jgi:formylmethanofuran dehydrogenase subunit E
MTTRINESYEIHNGRVSVGVRAEPITVDTDDAGDGVADAIATAIADGIRGVTATTKGKSHRLFNDTGRLANGITVERSGDVYAIVPPPDRLNPDDFRSAEAYQHVIDQLHANVPATAEPLEVAAVEAAIAAALDRIVR